MDFAQKILTQVTVFDFNQVNIRTLLRIQVCLVFLGVFDMYHRVHLRAGASNQPLMSTSMMDHNGTLHSRTSLSLLLKKCFICRGGKRMGRHIKSHVIASHILDYRAPVSITAVQQQGKENEGLASFWKHKDSQSKTLKKKKLSKVLCRTFCVSTLIIFFFILCRR